MHQVVRSLPAPRLLFIAAHLSLSDRQTPIAPASTADESKAIQKHLSECIKAFYLLSEENDGCCWEDRFLD